MKVLILGSDGYLGWPLTQYLSMNGHSVVGVDNLARRRWVQKMGSTSAIPVSPALDRQQVLRDTYGIPFPFYTLDIVHDVSMLKAVLVNHEPDAIVHLAECPSAPYSMQSRGHATWVQQNNVVGTLNILWLIHEIDPDIHLVKLGTMGEYGTPNMRIPEGFFEVEYQGRKDRLPFPRQAGSFYHLSKVHDSHNVMFTCESWGLRSTDIMQGVVYGTRFPGMPYGDDRMRTRLDFDEAFGTIINRFVCQAVIGEPLTLYGEGAQKRGFIPLAESMECIRLIIENPPEQGEYRVFNQLANVFSAEQLAHLVSLVAGWRNLDVETHHYENPRTEQEVHFYDPVHQKLGELGYQPKNNMMGDLDLMLSDLLEFRDRIKEYRDVLVPSIQWDGERRKVQTLP